MHSPDEDPASPPSSAEPDPETRDGLEHVSNLLIELWKDYKSSHLPNLIYSVAFVGGVLTLGNTSELFKRVSDDGRILITLAVFLCISAAGMAMTHRFTSQLFMEIETLPANNAMRHYYRARNSTYKKMTFSYGYSPNTIEIFKFLHITTKYLTSLFLYFAWVMFALALVLAFLKPADCLSGTRLLSDNRVEHCTWSKTEYSNFIDWMVTWLAKDCPLGWTIALLSCAVVYLTCRSLRQPYAYRPKGDRFGPIAWPILIGSTAVLGAHIFCFYHGLTLFGFALHKNRGYSIAIVIILFLVAIISAWRLKERANRLNPEFGDHYDLPRTKKERE